MTLSKGILNTTYTVEQVRTNGQAGMKDFLSSLGCYPGEKITVVSKQASNYVIHIKNVRYCIDEDLAQAIYI